VPNHWRITHWLLQWAKLFHIANAALQNLVPCLGLSLWVRLNCKHSWPRSKDMVRKYHHFLFLFLMTRYMRFSLKCIWHTLLSSNITENLKLLWLWLLSGEKKWVYDAWINHKNINWPLFVCFIRQGLCALGNIIFFRSARLASMAQHHYKFSLKRALRLPQQTKKPSQNINHTFPFHSQEHNHQPYSFPVQNTCRWGLYILPSFVMLLVLGDWSLGARNNKWWNRERLF